MVDAETEADAAAETKRKETREALVEEDGAMVEAEVTAGEQAEEATTTTTMQKEAMVTSMEVEAAGGTRFKC